MISFDTMMLAGVSREMEEHVIGAQVERIAQPIAHATQWTLFARGLKSTLVIESDAASSRMHLTHHARQSPPNPPAFCMLLRKMLGGAWLEGIEHPQGMGERVARLVFAGVDGRRYMLYVELMGRHSNQILTNEEGTILGAIKRVTPDMSRVREIRPGIPYTQPPRPRGTKRDVFSPVAGNDLPMIRFETEGEAEKWVSDAFSGVSPLMAREGVARRPQGELTAESIWYGLNHLINYARLADYSPVLITDDLGRITGAYPVALRTVPGVRQPVAASFSAAVDAAVEALEQQGSFEKERTALLAALRRARRILESEILDIQEGLANTERADEYRTAGDMILASLGKIRAGSETTKALDYETGEEREIDLDPTLTARQNALRYFKRYRKATDARESLEERLELARERLARIEETWPEAEAAATVAAVQAVAASLDDIREVKDRPSGEGGADPAPPNPYPGYKIRTYHSVDGWEILVGENAESNDYITTRVAKPSDIWLHARSQVSAHAIIRSRNRPAAVSTAALRYAAEQVARRSQAKHSSLVPVDYTLKKYVTKPRGAKPGQVLYSREKTLDVMPDVRQ